jgi:PAS domain S-box-containing protein
VKHDKRIESRAIGSQIGAPPTVVPDVAEIADDAVHESEAYHRANFIRAPVPMFVPDARALITDVSDRWLDLLGYRRQDVVGRPVSDFQERTSARQTAAAWEDFLARGEIRDVERCFLRRDGSMLNVLLSATVERSPGAGEVRVIAALVDVTGRKHAEAALKASEEGLRHAQKMEAIGQLTGGIAHDFNNVLQAVTGNLELILGLIRNDRPDVMRLADNALDAARKATAITSQLLAFARSQRLDLKPLDPIEVIDGIHDLLARTAGERIALQIDAPEQRVGACLADLNQLQCALLNLVINARDAIGGAAGTITISLRAGEVETASQEWRADGGYVRIAVRDDGPGMPEEVRRRAFEPFFTTKGPGKGTGLGLAQIRSFAHQSSGMALIESAPGKGTEVALLLPSTNEPTQDIPTQDNPRSAVPAEGTDVGFGETVLIVEDDALVRTTLAETLCDLAYQIVEAADADAALALLENGVTADMILTDLSMPGSMDGLEFAFAARSRFPKLPVILTTGHVGFTSGKALPPGVTFLRKPHSRTDIAAAIRNALTEGQHVVAA